MLEERDDLKVYIHIGLPRTGTTWLQKKVFPKLTDVKLFTKYNTTHNRLNPLFCNLKSEKINLISTESLSGFTGLMKDKKNMVNRFEKAKILKKIYPNASIILVLRDKNGWTKSMYKRYIHKSYRDFATFNEYKESIDEYDLDFESYVILLKSLFDDVLVLDFNLLKNDNRRFVKEICDFMDIEVPKYSIKKINKSKSFKDIKKREFINLLRNIKCPKSIIGVFETLIWRISTKSKYN